jgi:hypothetical protein
MPRQRSRCSIYIHKNWGFFTLRFLCGYVPSITVLHYFTPLYSLIWKLWQTYRCDYIKIEDGGSISSRAKEFCSPPNSPYQLCSPFNFVLILYWDLFLSPGTNRPVLKLTAHFCLVSKFRKRGPAPSFTHIPSCCVQENVYLTSIFHNCTKIGMKWPNLH